MSIAIPLTSPLVRPLTRAITEAGVGGGFPYVGGALPAAWDWSPPGERMSIVFIGDSVTAGARAGSTETTWATIGHVGLLRTELQSRHGDGGFGWIGLRSGNLYWVRTGTWTQVLTHGPFFESWQATGATNVYTLTVPDGDNIDLFYAKMSGYGEFTYTVDGGADIPVPTSGAADESTVRLNIALGSVGAHTVVVKAPASGTVTLIGAAIYKGSTGLVVHNMSKSGASATTCTGGGSVATAAARFPKLMGVLEYLEPRISAVGFRINDQINNNNPTTIYKPLMQVIANYCATFGHVMTWLPPDSDITTTFPIASYETASKEVAVAASGFWLDVHQAWGAYAANASRMFDTVHPNTQGHEDMRDLFLPVFERLGA